MHSSISAVVRSNEKYRGFFLSDQPKALAKRYSQLKQLEPSYKIKTCISGGPNGTVMSRLEPSYKIETCIGGSPNGTAKSRHHAGKPFNCLTTTAESPDNNETTWREWAEVAKQRWKTSSQLAPSEWQTTANWDQTENLARVGLSSEYRWPGLNTLCVDLAVCAPSVSFGSTCPKLS